VGFFWHGNIPSGNPVLTLAAAHLGINFLREVMTIFLTIEASKNWSACQALGLLWTRQIKVHDSQCP
jgi:hypothetical protein